MGSKNKKNEHMNITLLCVGKTDESYLLQGIDIFRKRLEHYISFEIIEVTLQKKWNKLRPEQQKQKEAELILPHMARTDFSVLLDEKGKLYTSEAFSNFLQIQMNRSLKNILFVVGGPWGFSKDVYESAQMKLSLSSMTFSHQMVRLFFVEQLYRAMTILRNESYHNP
jgi:23S rRNA (pseudouridine1915-N3)-methyltransferase